MKIYYVAILCCFMQAIECDFVRLPKEIAEQPILHISRTPVEDINGCFRALFDACNIEETCGIPNRYSDYEDFFSYFAAQKINYKALGVVVNSIPALAKKHLGIDVFCVNSAGILSSAPFPRGLGEGLSAEKSAQIIERAVATEHLKCQENINQLLNDGRKERLAIHFLHATGQSVTLLSLVQTKQGRIMFVCNQNNTPLGFRIFSMNFPCATMHCLKVLMPQFCPGSLVDFKTHNELKNINFPSRWPSIPQLFLDRMYEKVEPVIQTGRALITLGGYGLFAYTMWKGIPWIKGMMKTR